MGCGASPLDASPAGEDGTSGQEKGATTGKAGELSKAASMGDASPTAEETLTETTIFARLVAELGRQPERYLALTVIRKRLTEMNLPTLRQRAEDTGYLRKWLQKFPGLLELTGPPGAEQLRLTLGRAPQAQPPASGTSGGGGARAPPGGSDPRAQEGGGEVKCSLSRVATVVVPLACESADEALSPCTVQLRGLPFTATVADIRGFLGDHTANLVTTEPAIRCLLKRDGKPSGFARLQFTCSQAAKKCREQLHCQFMGDRYVEVLACNDSSAKARNVKRKERARNKRVLEECRDHIRVQGKNQLLLSTLGVALSPSARKRRRNPRRRRRDATLSLHTRRPERRF